MVRVIKPESEESRDNIIFSTNNQTSIPKSSLRVTDTIHLQIEMYFKNHLGFTMIEEKTIIRIKKESFRYNKCILSCSVLNFSCIEKTGFCQSKTINITNWWGNLQVLYEENQELEAYYKAAKIGRKIQNALKSNESMSNTEVNDILFYVIYATVADKMKKKNLLFRILKN